MAKGTKFHTTKGKKGRTKMLKTIKNVIADRAQKRKNKRKFELAYAFAEVRHRIEAAAEADKAKEEVGSENASI